MNIEEVLDTYQGYVHCDGYSANTQRRKKELMSILEGGRLVLSNNLAERRIPPLTIGRKKFMFSTSVTGRK